MKLRMNAKVNLFLKVAGRRPDGFHEIETIFQTVSLADELTASVAPVLEVQMRAAGTAGAALPGPEENLVTKAARALQEVTGTTLGARIEVDKRIPVAAGLGGGSADAAGTLLALVELWRLDVPRDELHRIAADLGSDVPYCLGGGTALAAGRGESLTSLPATSELWFVLGLSRESLLTRDVYELWDTLGSPEEAQPAPMMMALGARDVEGVAALLHNDLEAAAVTALPQLAKRKEALIEAGALGAIVSGSGPTILGMARDEEHAEDVARRVRGTFDTVCVVASRPACVESIGAS